MEANHESSDYSATCSIEFLVCARWFVRSTDIALFFARLVIMIVPISLLILLPAGLVVRYLMRRAKRMRLAQALATPGAD